MVDIETPPSNGPGEPDGFDGAEEAPAMTPLALLIAEGLEQLDTEGDDAFEAFCRQHPEHSAEIAASVRALVGTGLAGAGRRMGHYRIIRPLGRGGMGVVYLAEDTRLSRVVALKALPSQLVQNERALLRFRREARAVASLRHPCIVPVYDVGDDEHQPYFTMEYVEGRTLDSVIRSLRGLDVTADKLDTTDLGRATFLAAVAFEGEAEGHTDDVPTVTLPRTWGRAYVQAICRLVLDIADALEHAHRHGIVHRDVKPSNILVGRDGRAQLFDFGLAHTEANASLTVTGDFTGTPYYVSPEQALGEDTDARTDVYSLGVTLYELLTLTRPFEGRTNHEVFKRVHGSEPVAPRRRNPSVPRDLQTICLTALEKDPMRRYPSAAEMAADLLRFLDYQPLRVRPVGAVTRVWRWMRRKPWAATAAGLGLLVAVGTPIGLAIHAKVLGEANDKLTTSLETLREADDINVSVNGFILDLLRSADPSVRGADVTMRELLGGASRRIARDFRDEPAVEAELRKAIGHSFEGLGLFAPALAEYERVLELRRAQAISADEPGDSARDLRAALSDVGVVLGRLGRDGEAHALLSEALTMAKTQPGMKTRDLGDALFNLASLNYKLGDDTAARGGATASLAMRRMWVEVSEEGSDAWHDARIEVASSHVLLGNLARRGLEYDEAEEHYRAALERLEADKRGAVDAARARSELGVLYETKGDLHEARVLFEDAIMFSESRLGAEHPVITGLRLDLARVLWSLDLSHEALPFVEDALAALTSRGASDARVGQAQVLHARVLATLGHAEQAADAALKGYAMLVGNSPVASFTSVEAAVEMAALLRDVGRADEALPHLMQLERASRAEHGGGHWLTTACLESLVEVYEHLGRDAAADAARSRIVRVTR